MLSTVNAAYNALINYMTHQMRRWAQDNAKFDILSTMESDCVHMVLDFAMKWKSTSLTESQADYFSMTQNKNKYLNMLQRNLGTRGTVLTVYSKVMMEHYPYLALFMHTRTRHKTAQL
jgi:hypothetical protein